MYDLKSANSIVLAVTTELADFRLNINNIDLSTNNLPNFVLFKHVVVIKFYLGIFMILKLLLD